MLRSVVAVAVPPLVFAYGLSHTDPHLRAAMVETARRQLGFASPVPAAAQANAPRAIVALGAPALGPDTFAIDADRGGQFQTAMLIGGRQFPCMVDTGATYVALTYETAISLGLHVAEADFKYAFQTANGTVRVASTVLRSIRVGNVEARDVPATINAPGTLTGSNLLGMSFLRKLSGFEIQSGRLVLKQ